MTSLDRLCAVALVLFSSSLSFAEGQKTRSALPPDAGAASISPPQVPRRGGFSMFHEGMMRSTFRYSGGGDSNMSTVGTAFVIGVPCPNTPSKVALILVTAHHILNRIVEDEITLIGRAMQDGHWETRPVNLSIRNKGKPLWKKHPKADVAVMHAQVSDIIQNETLLLTEFLANDGFLDKHGIGPGDEIFSLGYPFGKASDSPGEFPLLRSGRIASYPLVPTAEVRLFNIDLRVFPGNSGGPVYLVQNGRTYGGAIVAGVVFGVLGVLIGDVVYEEKSEQAFDTVVRQRSLNLGRVVHASLIAETVALLPKPPECN